MVRLNKFIADCGIASRRKADELIQNGEITINGRKVTELGTKVDPDKDVIFWRGNPIKTQGQTVIYLFNKPKGVVTTSDDPEGRKTVLDFVPREPRVYACGRLDVDTMGLVILTNDGDLCYRLSHPKFEHQKQYLVEGTCKNPIAAINILESGVVLKDGPVQIDELSDVRHHHNKINFKIKVHEGRNRLVRRICSKVGIELKNLTRLSVGKYTLDDITQGKYKIV